MLGEVNDAARKTTQAQWRETARMTKTLRPKTK